MSQISKISINGTEYNLSEKLSSYYISYESPAFPEPGDSVETAISKLHADVELISNLGYLSEDYTAYTTSLGVEPQPDDSIELAISKLHRVILDNEYAIAASLIDINKKTFKYITLVYDNSDDLYYFIDENGNDITLDTAFGSDSYITNHTIIKYYDNDTYIERQYYPYDTNCNKYISIDDKNIYWLTFEIDSNDDVIVQLEQQPFESQFINSVAYNISQSDISNWNNKPDSFTETDPTVASYIKAITQSDISNWNSKTSNVGTITGITMNNTSKGTSGVVDLGTVLTEHQTLKTINNTSLVGSGNITINENVQSDWNASSGSAVILNKPTIPTVNDTTVTLTMNGSIVGTFTLNKNTNTTIDLGTVLTAHQSLKTINNNTITGTGNISIQGLPTVTSSDNGKVLMVVNGEWQLVSPVTLYSGSGAPNNAQGNNGDIYVQS